MNGQTVTPQAQSALPSSDTPHPALVKRKIIHFDMDCFYAAVEVRDDPSLLGKPVIVGGSPESRGVVCTASYEARKFGVHSAMACAQAKRLCPDGIFIRPDFKRYQAASAHIRDIFRRYTQQIEPLSLDEAYLDVTHNPQGLYAVKIAKQIQSAIAEELGLSGSAGIGPNKLVAKIASDFRKPKGLTVVVPHRVTAFMHQMPLRKISGIGPASDKRLKTMGFIYCQDVWPHRLGDLQARLGARMGSWLYWRSRGIDERPVQPTRSRKSLGKEDTFAADTNDLNLLKERMGRLADQISTRLVKQNLQGKTITLKVKYANFQQITRSMTLEAPIYGANDILNASFPLLQKTEVNHRKVRLIGITLSKLSSNKPQATLMPGDILTPLTPTTHP